MEIPTLKTHLNIYEVAERLGININKHHKANCPFHNDKTPSLQFSKEKQIATCFSGNCTAGTMDVISLAEKKLQLSTHEAIKWLQQEFSLEEQRPTETKSIQTNTAYAEAPAVKYQKLFRVFEGNLKKSSKAKAYLKERGLDLETLEVGYNGTAWEKMKHCVIFPLKDRSGQIVSFYGRSIIAGNHFYNSNRKGLHPGSPNPETETLILTESVIDATTLLQYPEITKQHNVLALYGTNGLTSEHQEAIKELHQLKEIILFLDGDEAGKEAVKRNGEILHQLSPEIKLTYIETPEGEDINSLAINHSGEEKELFAHLIGNRKRFYFSKETPKTEKPTILNTSPCPVLDTKNPYKLTYKTTVACYAIMGGLKKELDSMRVTLVIAHKQLKSRNKLDLYEDKQVEKTAREAAEKLDLRPDLVEADLNRLTDLLEEYRDTQQENETPSTPKITLTADRQKQCITYLSQPNLIPRLNDLIGKSGVIGEDNNRIFLFGIASSYKMPDTLHALIQGSSGSGKTHLLSKISNYIPEEDKKHFTRVTEGSFYNYGLYDLQNTLICLEDLDGMKEDAYLAFRELQSRGMISSSTSGKDDDGNIRAFEKIVYGPIASMSCTTKGEVYEDNMNRCFLIAVDETKAQTGRIIQYQNQKASGQIDSQKEQQVTQFIKDCVRMLKPYQVVNPYANKVNLPEEAHKIRRLNDLYQSYVKQITLLNQYRRSKDNKGRLVCEKEDLQVAADIMFDSIVLKIDELDGSLRDFYERLKAYVKSKGEHPENYAFGQREIRQALHISKTQLQRYVHDLIALEYIRQTGGHANRGFTYKILYWDNIEALRAKVKRHLQGQLDQLELLATHSNGSPDGSPEKEQKAV